VASYLLVAGLVAFAAQPPKSRDPKAKPKKKIGVEDYDPKGTVKKKIVVDDPDPPVGPKKGSNVPGATHPTCAWMSSTAPPPRPSTPPSRSCSSATRRRSTGSPRRATRSRGFARSTGFGGKTTFRATVFQRHADRRNGQALEPRSASVADIKKLDSFEQVVLARCGMRGLKQKPVGTGPGPDDLSGEDQLAAAEKLLAAAFPLPRVRQGQRHSQKYKSVGGTVRKPLHDRLARRTAPTVATIGGRAGLAAGPAVRHQADDCVSQGPDRGEGSRHRPGGRGRAPDEVQQPRGPSEGAGTAGRIRIAVPRRRRRPDSRTPQATHLRGGPALEQAKRLKAANNATEARNELDRAEALDPTIPGLREMKKEIGSGYPVLYVGVRSFPERLSPATAQFDSEKHAVELLFEGLLEEVPDGSGGVRYRTGAALAYPAMIPGGRELLIRQTPRAANGIDGFDAHDVVETIKMLRTRPELPVSAGSPGSKGLPTPTGAARCGSPSSTATPTPAPCIHSRCSPAATSPRRARDSTTWNSPPGPSAPARTASMPWPSPAAPGRANWSSSITRRYGRSKDRVGHPAPARIRFVEIAKLVDPFDDFRRGKLHILPDLTPLEMKQALDQGGAVLGGKGQVVTASTNRRVHILAVTIAAILCRTSICARASRWPSTATRFSMNCSGWRRHSTGAFTAPMSGPFPPNSWATVKAPGGLPVPLVNRADAAVRLKRLPR